MVASVFIYGEVENNNMQGAAAVAIVLITLSLIVLLLVNSFQKRRGIQA
jgi:sulfate transport system permease protein